MAYVNRFDLLHREIGDALREPEFRELFNAASGDVKETSVVQHLRRRVPEIEVTSVVKANVLEGEYLLKWRTDASEEADEHQWFSPSREL